MHGAESALPGAFGSAMHTALVGICMLFAAMWMFTEIMACFASRSTMAYLTLGIRQEVLILLLLLPLLLAVELSFACRGVARYLLHFLPPFVYLVALVYYGWRHFERLSGGLNALVHAVLPAVNSYYGTVFSCDEGSPADMAFAVVFVAVAAGAFFLVQALWLRKRLILVLFPILVLLGGMLIGYAPTSCIGILLLFVGILLSNCKLSRRVPFAQIAALVVVFVVVPLACFLFLRPVATDLANAGQQILAYQRELAVQLMEFWTQDREQPVFSEDWAHVSADSRVYTGQEVLRVTTDASLKENLYLRGFYATDYTNGEWTADETEFDEEMQSTGLSESKLYQAVSYMGLGQASPLYRSLTVKYLSPESAYVYAPYTVQLSDLEDGLALVGDYRLTKDEGSAQVTYHFWNLKMEELRTKTPAVATEEQEWYTQYVQEHYLDVQERMDYLADVVDSVIRSRHVLREAMETLSGEDTDAAARNEAKLALAEAVRDYFADWTYSLAPPQPTGGTDIIEYFLTTSHTGYCVHYATAAVLILRECGVPARYAAGYLMRRGSIVDTLGEGHTYQVLDSDAHAWPEIYLEGIGWVPFEVTPGYSATVTQDNLVDYTQGTPSTEAGTTETSETEMTDSENMETESEVTETENTSATETEVDVAETEQVDGTEVEDVDGTEADNSEADDIDTENENRDPEVAANTETGADGISGTEIDLTGSGTDGANGTQSGGSATANHPVLQFLCIALFLFLVILLVAAIVGGIVAIIVHRHQVWIRSLKSDLHRKRNRRVVRRLNTRIYARLRRKARTYGKHPTDREYLALLEKHYPQPDDTITWPTYLAIVQKAAFSREEITDEEARYCYACYHEIFNRKS